MLKKFYMAQGTEKLVISFDLHWCWLEPLQKLHVHLKIILSLLEFNSWWFSWMACGWCVKLSIAWSNQYHQGQHTFPYASCVPAEV